MINREDMEKGVKYIRSRVHSEKDVKRCDKKLFDDYLDNYFKKTWLRKKMIDMFNYNDSFVENPLALKLTTPRCFKSISWR